MKIQSLAKNIQLYLRAEILVAEIKLRLYFRKLALAVIICPASPKLTILPQTLAPASAGIFFALNRPIMPTALGPRRLNSRTIC